MKFTLEKKTLLIVGLTMACLLVLLYFGTKVILLRSLNSIEEKEAWYSIRRTEAALSEMLEDLVPLLQVWANSGDVREFLVSGQPENIPSAFSHPSLFAAGLDFLVVADQAGKIVLERVVDRGAGEPVLLPEDLRTHLSPDSAIFDHREATGTYTGLLMLGSRAFMIASKPVGVERQDPVLIGTLVLGRYFDNRKIAVLERLVQQRVTLVSIEAPGLSEEFQEALYALDPSRNVYVNREDEDTLAAYTQIKDIYNQPALLLRLDIPRTTYLQGKLAERMLFWSLITTEVGVTIMILRLLHTEVVSRIAALGRRVRDIAAKADSSQRVSASGHDEIRVLAESINHLLESLQNSEKALQKSLQAMREAQAQLVQSEKMAALGALVAGVAHEINTPVGIGVTAASYLEQSTRRVAELYARNELRQSEFKAFLESGRETAEILLSNMRRASDLIRSFKQVAADQTSEQRRTFRVKQYIHEILTSLRPALKKTDHRIVVNCPDDLELDSYPGAFSHVLTNMIMNSLIHGFSEGVQGEIVIEMREENNSYVLSYSDNGRGIEKESLPRIFEPFYTTRRGGSSAGLGLHIVYNVVTQTLRGTIECSSVPSEKTTFVVTIPKHKGSSGA